MAINERLIHTAADAAGGAGTGNQEEGLILHLDANDVDSYDGDGDEWVDIANHEYTPSTDVSEHFNTVIWSGDGATSRSITGVGFQPDLIWVKARQAQNHTLYDSVRGTGRYLDSSGTTQESTATTYGQLTSFDSDGFTGSEGSNQTYSFFNSSSQTYVAWCFKAGGTAVSNTDGTITSQVSANTDLGFSIVKYTGAASGTVGHGLGVPPEFIITKKPNADSYWQCYSETIGKDKLLQLNTNGAALSISNYWGTNSPNSTVFGLSTNSGHDPANGENIAYCFASKRGVSKVGSYVGNGTTDNKIVTGFQPAFVMLKNTSITNTRWIIMDNARDPDNTAYKVLSPNYNAVEDTSTSYWLLDWERDGFRLKYGADNEFNRNGDKYIYYAVAKSTNETGLTPNKDDFTAGSVETTDLELDLDANSYSGSGDWLDGTLNNHDGTITGTTYVNDGSADYFEFDGSGDSVTTSYSAPTGAKTMELWYNASTSYTATYPSVLGGTNEILWVGGNITGNLPDESIYWYQQPSRLGLVIREGVDKYLDNQWHHLVIVDTGSDHKMYVDGEEKSIYYTHGSASVRMDWDNLVLGRGYRTNGIDDFKGKIGQVRIYSSALTSAQIKSNYEATRIYNAPDLQLHLDAGDDTTVSTSTWSDLANSNDSTFTNFSSTLINFYDKELGNYINFNGSTEYVSTPYNVNPINDYTFEGWFNQDVAEGVIVWGMQNGDTTRQIYGGLEADGDVRLGASGGTSHLLSTSQPIQAGKWHHIAWVYNPTANIRKIYVDGEEVASATSSWTRNSSSRNIFIGARNTSGTAAGHYDGKIGQFRVYDSILSQADIRQNYNYTKPNYPNGYDGTITGATFFPSDVSFDFDGNDYIETSYKQGTNTSFSFAAWINTDTTTGRKFIIGDLDSGGASASGRFAIEVNGNNLRLSYSNGTSYASHSSTTDLSASTWYHVCVTISGTSVKMYIDGTETDSFTSSFLYGTAGIQNFTIGAMGDFRGHSLFNGQMSDIKLFDKELTAAEVTAQYNIGYNGIG